MQGKKEEDELTYAEHSTARMRDEIIDIHNIPKESALQLQEFLEYVHEPIDSIVASRLILKWCNIGKVWISSNYTSHTYLSISDFLEKYDHRKKKLQTTDDDTNVNFTKPLFNGDE